MRQAVKKLPSILLIFSLAVFCGCGKTSTPGHKQVASEHSPTPNVVVAPPEEKKPERAPVVFSGGSRDPFTSLIAIAKEKQKQRKSSNPMENFAVADIRVTAIVWDKDGYYALITLPDNKSYTIRKGMTLGLYGGKVEKISQNSVLVREHIRDYRGQPETKDTILRLREEGEQ